MEGTLPPRPRAPRATHGSLFLPPQHLAQTRTDFISDPAGPTQSPVIDRCQSFTMPTVDRIGFARRLRAKTAAGAAAVLIAAACHRPTHRFRAKAAVAIPKPVRRLRVKTKIVKIPRSRVPHGATFLMEPEPRRC